MLPRIIESLGVELMIHVAAAFVGISSTGNLSFSFLITKKSIIPENIRKKVMGTTARRASSLLVCQSFTSVLAENRTPMIRKYVKNLWLSIGSGENLKRLAMMNNISAGRKIILVTLVRATNPAGMRMLWRPRLSHQKERKWEIVNESCMR